MSGTKAIKDGAGREAGGKQRRVNGAAMIRTQVRACRVSGLVEAKALVGVECRSNAAQAAAAGAVRP
jgi:hypothetical protein